MPEKTLTQLANAATSRDQGVLSFESVRAVAEGVWHSSLALGDHTTLNEAAALLLQRLSWYCIVPQERKRLILAAIGPLLADTDACARYRFNRQFLRHLPRLQPLQTRHYVPMPQ